MASQMPVGDNSNTKSEEGTTAFHRKRARRVSFAENTSVHIFDRDEDSGTPVNPKPPNSPSDESASAELNDEPNMLFWNVEDDDNDNNNEDDDMDEPGSRSPFLRFVKSPSSGGSTVGSANSNDEDNFFGPVSANFIRRDLLDSEASDGDHDQTMDSTAFSMHFRSLARSDSEVELKTSTGVHLSFEDKTPTRDSIPTNTATTSMLMTLAKKPDHQPSVSTSKLSTSSESNDMSIVGEYRIKYDYGKLSPTLDALLAEGNRDLPVMDPSNVSILKSPRSVETTEESGAKLMDSGGGYDNSLEGTITHKEVNEIVSFKHNGLDVVNDGSKASPSKKIALYVSSDSSDAEIYKHLSPSSSNKVILNAKTNELVKDAFQIKQSHMVSPSVVTPSHDHSNAFVRTEIPKHGWSVPSIQKSISKLRMLEASPFSAALSAKLKDSTSKSLLSCMNDSGRLSSVAQKKRERASSTNMDDVRLETPMNPMPVTLQNFVKIASPEGRSSREKLQTELLSSTEVRNIYQDEKNKFVLPQSFGGSSQKKLKIVNTSEFKSSPLKDTNQFTEHNEPVKFGPSHVAGSVENVTNGSFSTTDGDKTDSLYIEKIEKSSPLISTEEEMIDISEVSVHEVHCNSERKEKSTILSEHEKSEPKFTRSDDATGETKIASPLLHGLTYIQSCRKNLHDQFSQSPLNKKPNNTSNGDKVDSLLEEGVNGDVNLESQRKNEDGLIEKIARTQRSPNLGQGYVGTELSTNNGISVIGHKFKHPTEINSMLSKETEELLSQSVDEFNLHAVDHLSSIVDQLLRSKTYQLLSDEIQSQKSVGVNKYIQQKRSAEMKLLLCKFVHEKAKLQLLHMKRERLLKRVKSLASGILESEVLRSNLSSQQAPGVHCEPLSVNMKDFQESQIDNDKVTSTNQALYHIDTGITNLTKSFHKSCKMKGEPGTGDTIIFVNNYMMKRARCQIIRKDLQLWAVDNLNSRNGSHSVVLNYLDLMTQRLTVDAGPVPSISISHELNNANISKIFKDMDACTAFEFVFNAGTTKKRVDDTSLAQETQITGSHLGILLDVVEEIHHARIELKNLISTRFYTHLAETLDLELCFFVSKHHRKATVTLDASCLKRGIYPSEAVPYQIDIPGDDPQSCSTSLSAEISSAIQDLTVGYSRIQRLCTCISKLISPLIS